MQEWNIVKVCNGVSAETIQTSWYADWIKHSILTYPAGQPGSQPSQLSLVIFLIGKLFLFHVIASFIDHFLDARHNVTCKTKIAILIAFASLKC